MSPVDTNCMKCQTLFSGKDKKNIINLESAEFSKSMLKVKSHLPYILGYFCFLHRK